MDKLICVGKNYLDHARELGDAVPEDPTYFLKPPSVLFHATGARNDVRWPGHFTVHHELELVLRLARRGDDWVFSHYTLGLDLTLRDLQADLKKRGLPWEKAKVFANSAVIGPTRPIEDLDTLLGETFTLTVNGEPRQSGRGRDMRWSPTEVLRDLPRWFPLREGDLLFTGTPAGVGPLVAGDLVRVTGPQIDYSLTVALDV
jgi:2-keto-4-pentenoate hydratase/2-oxohepta-3-ene-1,7-dioic acid hydratase in catechol pathway